MIRIALAIICAVVGCLLIARSFRALTRCARVVERSASRLARKRWLAILSVGLVSFGVNVALSRVSGVPNPVVHDEFSYLLAADTFAHGRLSNPTHRLWPHFETMHVLQRPTYSSKYPPGQGLLLAVGKRFGGGPIVGAWLGSALACAATCWMLMASVRPRWAFVGGLVATSNPYVVQWGQSYWGGSLGMLGGSLLLGGVFRSFRRTLWSDGLAIGLGLAILAVSRPYEGLALAMASLLGLAFRRSRVGGLRSLSETASLDSHGGGAA